MDVWFVFVSILLLIGNVLNLFLIERFLAEVLKCLLFAAACSDGESTVEVDLDA